MIHLSDSQKSNIALMMENAGQLQTAFLYARQDVRLLKELALHTAVTALVSTDLLEQPNRASEAVLMTNELIRLLNQLTFRCFDISDADESRDMEAGIRDADELCGRIAEIAQIPKYASPVDPKLSVTVISGTGEDIYVLQRLGDGQDPIARLKAEVKALRELLTSFVLERDNLMSVELRDIEAAYMRELGGLEAEIYEVRSHARLLKRKLEMMQARVNRGEPIQEDSIDEQLHAQYIEFRINYEELLRRIFEAAKYSEKREAQKTAPHCEVSSPDGEPAEPGAKAPVGGETEEQERKRLYRKIVKAMHPDLHPGQDEATKNLFKRAIEAYKLFDMKTLREIAALIDGDISDAGADLAEELKKEKARLLELIRSVRAEIRDIKSQYPYTKKKMLETQELLQAEKERLARILASAQEAVRAYQERIDELRKTYG